MKELFTATLAKIKLAHLFAIIISFLAPIQTIILTVGACIFADTFMGVWRAKKQGQQITSRRLSNIVSKMVLYQAAIILFFLIEKFILVDFITLFTAIPFFLTKLVACTLCFIECKSINENYEMISGISLFGKFKDMLTRAKELKEDIGKVNPEAPNGRTDI